MFDLIKKIIFYNNIFDSYISNSSGLFNIYGNDSHVSYDEKSYNIEIAIPGNIKVNLLEHEKIFLNQEIIYNQKEKLLKMINRKHILEDNLKINILNR